MEPRWPPRHCVSITSMSGEQRKNRKSELARAIAFGLSAAEWGLQNGVAKTTACRWARDPKVKAVVNSHRRKALDHALGVMSGQVAEAARAIGALGQNAASESVQLGALKAVFTNLLAVSKFAGVELRLTELEERFNGRSGNTTRPA
jgi:hypothetical protein